MPRRSRIPVRSLVGLIVLAGGSGCRKEQPAPPDAPPPRAEFLLAAGDSAFWVTSDGTVRVRGAPLELARVDGRFYELYVTDDDRSYEDAVLIGQRVYRRDLLSGDSTLVFQDTVVPRLAALYARLHPGDARLRPDEEPGDDPLWQVTATLDLTAVHGAFASYVSHTDVERDDAAPWHTSRRGVLDLRTARAATLAEIAGAVTPDVVRRRAESLRATLDSVRKDATAQGARAAAVLPHYTLDPTSFSLTTTDGGPAVAYAIPGAGDGDAGHALTLAPIPVGEPSWWPEVAASLPVGSANGSRDVWRHERYEVVVHYDAASGLARLALRDSTSREWTVGRVPAPATRIYWLDHPPLDSSSRRALDRAFEESSLYDEAVRTASLGRRAPWRRVHAVAWRRPAPHARTHRRHSHRS